jgi:hypothetical protein
MDRSMGVLRRSSGGRAAPPLEEMTLSREELVQLQYMELQEVAHQLFDDACTAKPFGRSEYTHFGPLLACGWDPSDQSWDEWLDSRSNCPYAGQRFDELSTRT